jgi:peptidyl-prolyl cis-trans isomerase D
MTPAQAVNRVWDQEVSIALLTDQFEKLGILTGEKHIMETFRVIKYWPKPNVPDCRSI